MSELQAQQEFKYQVVVAAFVATLMQLNGGNKDLATKTVAGLCAAADQYMGVKVELNNG